MFASRHHAVRRRGRHRGRTAPGIGLLPLRLAVGMAARAAGEHEDGARVDIIATRRVERHLFPLQPKLGTQLLERRASARAPACSETADRVSSVHTSLHREARAARTRLSVIVYTVCRLPIRPRADQSRPVHDSCPPWPRLRCAPWRRHSLPVVLRPPHDAYTSRHTSLKHTLASLRLCATRCGPMLGRQWPLTRPRLTPVGTVTPYSVSPHRRATGGSP